MVMIKEYIPNLKAFFDVIKKNSLLRRSNLRNYSKAFTLAEVLITLGIIGIVAEMTIPTLMNDVGDKVLKTSWVKAYSVFSQAYLNMQADDAQTWALSGIAMRDAFVPYFKIVQKCDNSGDVCWHSSGGIKTLPLTNGTQTTYADFSSSPGFTTPDGMKIIFMLDSATGGWIMIDVNGDKKPNVAGRDVFGMRFDGIAGKAFPFSQTEMGTCNPPAAGAAGSTFVGLGCSEYYLFNR